MPVLVVGAGPTGLMMASELTRHGIHCRIIEKASAPAQLSKALAIHARTLEIFENIGFADQFVAEGVKAHGGSVYAEGKRIVHFMFNGLESKYDYALMLPQDRTEALLAKHLETLGRTVERSTELVGLTQDGNQVTATLRLPDGREESCRADFIVGCDGAHSSVRHLLNLAFEGEAYEENFALADVHVDSSMPSDEIVGFASEKGIVFFFPITENRYRLIADVEQIRTDRPPTLQELQTIIDEQCHMGARLHDPKWTAYFKIHRRQAKSYRVGRAFLVGDAAHIHSPAGGQGMNTGLQDAYNLAWKLALAMNGIVKPAVLDSYAAERHAVGREVLKQTDAMTKMMELRSPVAMAIRNRIAAAISSTDIFQNMARKGMSELAVNYRESPIVAEYHGGIFGTINSFSGPRAGDRAPNAERLRIGGKPTTLFELLRTDKHKLLIFAGARLDAEELKKLVTNARQVADQHGKHIDVYMVNADSTSPGIPGWDGNVIVDDGDALHRAYHAVATCGYLIRPDGYIGYRSFPIRTEHLMDYLSTIFA